MSFNKIAVIGSGTMGRSIAQAAATSGLSVYIYDISADALSLAMEKIDASLEKGVSKGKIPADEKPGVLERIRSTTDMSVLSDIDLAIEAVPENLELKRKVFNELASHCASEAILATNTSSLSITAISANVEHPDRVAGLHFFNPAHIMKLVEVVEGRFTSDSVMRSLLNFVNDIGKVPVRVKDTPGFIVNRVARSFYSESLRILEERVAGIETIDKILTGHGFRMGPFTLMDLIGNDVNFEVTRTLYESSYGEPRYRPSQIQHSLVEAGLLGRKSGRGFYDYSAENE